MRQDVSPFTNMTMSSSCSNGILAMSTSNPAVPGVAMVKTHNGNTYLFAESDANSTNGATFTYTLSGLAGDTATVVYDSDAHYDSGNSSMGATHTLDGSGSFSDNLGANGDNYQVKIYEINGTVSIADHQSLLAAVGSAVSGVIGGWLGMILRFFERI